VSEGVAYTPVVIAIAASFAVFERTTSCVSDGTAAAVMVVADGSLAPSCLHPATATSARAPMHRATYIPRVVMHGRCTICRSRPTN
jgi:hypothetical protein